MSPSEGRSERPARSRCSTNCVRGCSWLASRATSIFRSVDRPENQGPTVSRFGPPTSAGPASRGAIAFVNLAATFRRAYPPSFYRSLISSTPPWWLLWEAHWAWRKVARWTSTTSTTSSTSATKGGGRNSPRTGVSLADASRSSVGNWVSGGCSSGGSVSTIYLLTCWAPTEAFPSEA